MNSFYSSENQQLKQKLRFATYRRNKKAPQTVQMNWSGAYFFGMECLFVDYLRESGGSSPTRASSGTSSFCEKSRTAARSRHRRPRSYRLRRCLELPGRALNSSRPMRREMRTARRRTPDRMLKCRLLQPEYFALSHYHLVRIFPYICCFP